MAFYPKTIRHLRQQLLLSQTKLAQKIRVSCVTISNWETRKFEPRASDLGAMYTLAKQNNIKFNPFEPLKKRRKRKK